jgi:hypothetical protein
MGGLEKPVEPGLAGGFGGEDEKLGDLVGVEAVQGGFEGVKISGGGLDEQQDFISGFPGSLPTVDGSDAGNDVDAGGETLVNEGASDALGFVLRDGGGEDQATIGGGYGHCGEQGIGNRVQRTAT